MNTKKVSIIMNCRNGEEYLEQSIKSVIDQTYKNWELIFVDNNSNDNSRSIFYKFNDERLKYFFLKKSVRLGEARQTALQNCSGEYIAFLDTDDLWFKKKLEKQLKFFDKKRVGMVISNTIFFSKNKEKIFYKKKPPTGFVFYDLLKKYFISLETLICKNDFIKEISFKFNKQNSMISDFELVISLSQICKLEYCPEILSKWRVHSSSDTWKKKELFYSEKFFFIQKLDLKNKELKEEKFLKCKKNFFEDLNFSIVLNKLEYGEKRMNLIRDLISKKIRLTKFITLLAIILLPFNLVILRIYRKLFDINP